MFRRAGPGRACYLCGEAHFPSEQTELVLRHPKPYLDKRGHLYNTDDSTALFVIDGGGSLSSLGGTKADGDKDAAAWRLQQTNLQNVVLTHAGTRLTSDSDHHG